MFNIHQVQIVLVSQNLTNRSVLCHSYIVKPMARRQQYHLSSIYTIFLLPSSPQVIATCHWEQKRSKQDGWAASVIVGRRSHLGQTLYQAICMWNLSKINKARHY